MIHRKGDSNTMFENYRRNNKALTNYKKVKIARQLGGRISKLKR